MSTVVFRTGGKQYRATQGDILRVATLAGNPGDKVSFDEVLAIGGDSPKIGTPLVKGAKVTAEIVAHDRGPKLVVFKFRRRKRYRRRNGHRQDYTAVKITDVAG
jgi:large subunit ribosomal protein L21